MIFFIRSVLKRGGYVLDFQAAMNLLVNIYPYYILFVFSILLIVLVLNLKTILSSFKDIKRKTWLVLIIMIGVILILKFYFSYFSYQTVDQESLYLGLAHSIAEKQSSCSCVFKEGNVCHICEPMLPPVFSTLYSLLFIPTSKTLFTINLLISALTMFAVFLLIYVIFKDEIQALIGSALLGLTPVHWKLSTTASVQIELLFFVLLSLFFFFLYLKNKTLFFESESSGLLLLSLLALIFALNLTGEFLVMLSLYVILFFSEGFFSRNHINSSNWKNYIITFLVFVFLLSFQIFYGMIYVETASPPLTKGSKMFVFNEFYATRANLVDNLSDNIKFFFSNTTHPIILTIFSLAGIFLMLRKSSESKRLCLFLLVWFLSFFIFKTSISTYNDFLTFTNVSGWQSTIILYLPIIIFSSYSLNKLLAKSSLRKTVFPSAILLLVISLYFTYPFINSKTYFQQAYELFKERKEIGSTNCLLATVFYPEHANNYVIPGQIRAYNTKEELINKINTDCVITVSFLSDVDLDYLSEDIPIKDPTHTILTQMFNISYKKSSFQKTFGIYNLSREEFIQYFNKIYR